MLRCIVAHLDSQALTNNNKFRLGKNLQRVCRLSDELRERVSRRLAQGASPEGLSGKPQAD